MPRDLPNTPPCCLRLRQAPEHPSRLAASPRPATSPCCLAPHQHPSTAGARRRSALCARAPKHPSTRWSYAEECVVRGGGVRGFGMGMVFYGMPLLVGSIAPNLYLSMVYNAVADLPASVATYFLLAHVNRRMSLVALTMFSGVASLLCVFRGINSNVQLAAEVSN
ncbi:organic cation/carnitine transporter 3-like protein [Carex littledalei]|uniref:Organic cation/carnitine transporter 3-like protein n=1 Tax=Carex littledalei TaxID=544730 RepID=A0A833RF09_9POAL|nr:organic cation/carnitine transporter 3-like protein [Carex littledalei]